MAAWPDLPWTPCPIPIFTLDRIGNPTNFFTLFNRKLIPSTHNLGPPVQQVVHFDTKYSISKKEAEKRRCLLFPKFVYCAIQTNVLLWNTGVTRDGTPTYPALRYELFLRKRRNATPPRATEYTTGCMWEPRRTAWDCPYRQLYCQTLWCQDGHGYLAGETAVSRPGDTAP